MPWFDGDNITSANLNNRGASATSSTGYSTNTFGPESGNTITFSVSTIDFSQSRFVSTRTLGASLSSANVAADEMVFSVQASGASLAIRSGSTVWIFSSSVSTVA